MGSASPSAKAALLFLGAVVIAACGDDVPANPLAGGIVATFEVTGQQFKVWITNDGTIEDVLALQSGESTAHIPNGPILRGNGAGDHNAPHGWHLDPEQTEMADVTIEVCDGAPSYVDEHIDEYVDVVGRYCPWGAEFVGIEDHR